MCKSYSLISVETCYYSHEPGVNVAGLTELVLPIWLLPCMSPEVTCQVSRAWEYFPTVSIK